MTYYYKKRKQSGLERSDVANLLGISYARYESIERGNVKMPKNLIDRFNEIMNRTKGKNKIEQLNREQVVEQWWNEIKNDKEKLLAKMAEFNIGSYQQLASLLGYKDGSSISNYLNGNYPCSYNFKNKLYSFFENELNIQNPRKSTNRGYSISQFETKEGKALLQWYKDFDFVKWLKENNLPINQTARRIGIAETTFHYLVTKKHLTGPNIKNIRIVKDFIDNYSSNIMLLTPEEHKEKHDNFKIAEVVDEEIMEGQLQHEFERETESEAIIKGKLIKKYSDKLHELNKEKEFVLSSIRKLETQLQSIQKQEELYEEFMKEIYEA